MQRDLQKLRDGSVRASPGAEDGPKAGEEASTDGVLTFAIFFTSRGPTARSTSP